MTSATLVPVVLARAGSRKPSVSMNPDHQNIWS